MQASENPILYYIYDPMCSWCWGFDNTWKMVKNLLPDSINVQYILGGLAPDSNEIMPNEMQEYIQMNWRKIEKKIPGVKFNNDFWKQCNPKRSTYPACRAVIAVKNQNTNLEQVMITMIQQAYYLHAKNPSEKSTLILLAKELDLDIEQFTYDLESAMTQLKLEENIKLMRSYDIHSMPSLVLVTPKLTTPIVIDYNNPKFILDQIIA